MTVWRRRLVWGLAILMPAIGEGATKEDPLARRLCDALHSLPAKRKQECCGAAASLAEACAQEVTASIRRGATSLDAARIDRCSAETERQLQGCAWVTPLQPSRPAPCGGLLDGKLGAGLACRSSLECGDGLYCRGLSPTAAGVCRPPAETGARCEVPADNLAAFALAKDDLRHPECKGRCVKGQCLALAPLGQACVSSALCASGLNCIAGRCQALPLPRIGESCAGKTSCEAGAFCDAGTCAAVKGAGESCAQSFECRALACIKAPGAAKGACADACTGGPASAGKPSR